MLTVYTLSILRITAPRPCAVVAHKMQHRMMTFGTDSSRTVYVAGLPKQPSVEQRTLGLTIPHAGKLARVHDTGSD